MGMTSHQIEFGFDSFGDRTHDLAGNPISHAKSIALLPL